MPPSSWKSSSSRNNAALSTSCQEREEVSDEVFELLEKKKRETLAYKRSFFVRMVSDPKIYNPKCAKSLPGRRHTSHVTEDEDDFAETTSENGHDEVHTPIASWISWPLAFLFHEAGANELAVRFRHLDTMVHLPSKKDNNALTSRRASLTPSPEYIEQQNKSPAKSPNLRRKSPNPR